MTVLVRRSKEFETRYICLLRKRSEGESVSSSFQMKYESKGLGWRVMVETLVEIPIGLTITV